MVCRPVRKDPGQRGSAAGRELDTEKLSYPSATLPLSSPASTFATTRSTRAIGIT